MSNAVNLLRPDVAFELNRRIVKVLEYVYHSLLYYENQRSFHHQVLCAQPHVLNEIVCRDAYVYEYHRVPSAGTMSPV